MRRTWWRDTRFWYTLYLGTHTAYDTATTAVFCIRFDTTCGGAEGCGVCVGVSEGGAFCIRFDLHPV